VPLCSSVVGRTLRSFTCGPCMQTGRTSLRRLTSLHGTPRSLSIPSLRPSFSLRKIVMRGPSCYLHSVSSAMPVSEVKTNVEVNGVSVDRPQAALPLLPLGSALPLSEICARVRERVDAFLAEEPATEQLRSVQEQTRISLGVLDEALRRYKYVINRTSGIFWVAVKKLID
jgi:hypothetical protein